MHSIHLYTHYTEVKRARAGDIVAIVGLKDTTTGDTLCDPTDSVILERMEFPVPVIKVHTIHYTLYMLSIYTINAVYSLYTPYML